MTNVTVPEDFLSMVLIGRCNRRFRYACSIPEGQYTDFNIWDRFLETDQLIEWTKCK